jgi:hypothetical protein
MTLIGILKYSEKNLSQLHFVHHKCPIDWLGLNSGLHTERLAAKCLSHTAFMESGVERGCTKVVQRRIFGTTRGSNRRVKIV